MTTRALAVLVGLLMSGGLTACGPSESDYVEACLAMPDANAERCRCRASEGKARLSAKAWEAFVLDMQGKDEESSAALAQLSIDEQSAFIGAAIEINRKCGGDE
jgi:hypothetical protein